MTCLRPFITFLRPDLLAVQSASGLGSRALTFRKIIVKQGVLTTELHCRTLLFFHRAWIYTREVLCFIY